MDGAHRARRIAADDAAAPRRAGVRGAAAPNARDGRRARARTGARAGSGTRRALRESARQVAHELKNPLTPIRFAVERLRRDADRLPPELAETIDVLAIESARLENMARSFAQFGRLPEGPPAEVDVGELARYTARATIPPELHVTVDVADDVPMIRGHHDALARALSNVMLNAVDACRGGGNGAAMCAFGSSRRPRGARVGRAGRIGHGCGIPAEKLARIWDPYVTSKPGGTGLGLAIARQTVLAPRRRGGRREYRGRWNRDSIRPAGGEGENDGRS